MSNKSRQLKLISDRRMKSKAIAFFCIFLLVGCGMSQKEKNDVAIVTCNIISETKEINGDDVLREVDKAREKIGEDKYLGNSLLVKGYINFVRKHKKVF